MNKKIKMEVKINKYKIKTTEMLQKTVEVEDNNKEDTMYKVMKMYKIQKL